MILSFLKRAFSVISFAFILSTLTPQITLAACNSTSGPFQVTQGNSAQISWSVVGASSCTADFTEGITYPIGIDTIHDAWRNGIPRSSVNTETLGSVKAVPGTYTFTCREPVSLKTGCALLQVNPCPNGTSWDGTACAAPSNCNEAPWGGYFSWKCSHRISVISTNWCLCIRIKNLYQPCTWRDI